MAALVFKRILRKEKLSRSANRREIDFRYLFSGLKLKNNGSQTVIAAAYGNKMCIRDRS